MWESRVNCVEMPSRVRWFIIYPITRGKTRSFGKGVVLEGLLSKGKAFLDEFSSIDAGTYASSIAYFTFLSLVPLLALCISLVSVVGIGEQEVVAFFGALVPDVFDGVVKELVRDAFERSGLAFSLSTITLLWSASKGIKALRAGLNSAFGVQETRNGVMVAAISIGVAIILGILIAAAMYLVFKGSVLRAIADAVPGFQQSGLAVALNPIAVLVLGVLVLGVCYAYLPSGTRRLSSQLPGAALAMLACGALSFGFRVYVEHFSDVTVLYGGIATVALLLLWIYLLSLILIAGGFVNRFLASSRSSE